jgi:Tol biopolymer transport system component
MSAPEKSVIAGFELSPDGRYVAFVTRGGTSKLWVRPIDSIDAQELPGTDGARPLPGQVFWSPDSSFIGFVAAGKLKKVSIGGGPPQTLTDVPDSARATWSQQGVILIAPGPGTPIRRVPATGGVSVPVTTPGAGESHFTPHFLPDGRHFLYWVTGKPETVGVYLSSLEEGAQPVRLLPDNAPARFAPSDAAGKRGHLLFTREGTLMAQPFDSETLSVTGEIFPVAESVTQFSVSANGALAYLSGTAAIRDQLVWRDRVGTEVGSVGPPGVYANFRLSPDERSIVFNRASAANTDIWVLDIVRGVPTRITFDQSTDNLPIWSHDGRRILWPSSRRGSFDLYIKPASGTGQDELLIPMGTTNGWATDWSRDGKWILFQRPGDKTNQDLWIAPQSPDSAGQQKPVPYLNSPFAESNGVFSPDGRWIAYVSNESGRDEVYVQAFPLTDEKDQISTGGGSDPAWHKDGVELFYLTPDRNLMAVPVRVAGKSFEPGVPKVLFPVPVSRTSVRRTYEPSSDGRFLIAKPLDDDGTVPMTLVLNWLARVKQ